MASKLSLFLAELKRRKVYRVAAVYAAVGVAISLAVPDLFGAFDLPNSASRLVILLILIGFPIALVLAWAYEIRPEEPPPPAATHEEEAPSPSVIPTESPRPSVAVLPFANLSADPENEYFSDGVTFDIINHLGKITDLKVISRTSIMRFKATDKPLRRIGEELGVASIVEGEVQRVGDRVRISAQLVDARTDEHLWADQYDRELLDVFAIQSEVAQSVAAALKAELTPLERERIERVPTGKFDAYTFYLKGRYFWDRRGEGLSKGLGYFQKALGIDPQFALAHAGVADCYSLLGFYGYLPPKEAWPKAKAAALKALEIDDGLAEAHTSLGWFETSYEWDPLAGETNFEKAIALNPGYAPAHYWYGAALLSQGRIEEAIARDERAVEVDPLGIFTNVHLGWVSIGGRDFGGAREALEKALELDPSYFLAHWVLGWCCGGEKEFDESVRHLRQACRLSGDFEWFKAHLGWACGASGREDEARTILAELLEKRTKQFIRSLYPALVHLGLGEREEALDWLEKAYEERDLWMAYLGVDSLFDPLRGEPRFDAILERVGVGRE